MRLTNVLNIGLLGLVLATFSAGIVTWVGTSAVQDQLDLSRLAEGTVEISADLGDALRDYQRTPNTEAEANVRDQIAAMNRSVAKLREAGVQADLVSNLEAAERYYAAAYETYVEQEALKAKALATVNTAAISLKDIATEEAELIESENARAIRRAQEIERQQSKAFQSASGLTEILVAVSRMRQATDLFLRTTEEGAARNVRASQNRMERAITGITELNDDLTEGRRFRIFKRWLDAYMTLFNRATELGRDAPGMKALQSRQLKRAAVPLQTEADRLHKTIQAELRAAIDDANLERDRLFLIKRRNAYLTGMRQALLDALGLVRILKETEGGELASLAEGMTMATRQLRNNANWLFSVADRMASSGLAGFPIIAGTIPSHDHGAAEIESAIAHLDVSWKAAVTAAAEQEAQSREMSAAASEANAIVRTAIHQVDENLKEGIDDFLVFLSLAIIMALLGSVLGAGYVYRHMTQPLAALTGAITRLAKGDLTVPMPRFQTGVELMELAEAAEVLRRSSLQQIELERENAQKEHRLVQERAEAEKLEITLHKEQEKMQLQRKFVSMVSHEFRTPLAIIDGQAQGILRRLDEIKPDVLQSRLGKVRSNVERLIGLMESMLASSRLEAGTISFAPEEHDLRELVAEICAHQNEISSHHDIVVDIEPLPRRYVGDPGQLRQAMSNLLSNAVKYSPSAKQVDVIGVDDGDGYRIHVRDYGLGIPEAEMSKIASQYFRASTSTGIAGTGIGLHLVKALVDMHGGSLDVDSSVNEGSTFSIFLPHNTGQQAA